MVKRRTPKCKDRPSKRKAPPPPPTPKPKAPPPIFANFCDVELTNGDGKPHVVRVGLPLPALARDLHRRLGDWPKRIGNLLFVEGRGHQPLLLPSTDSLFAWIGGAMPLERPMNPIVWAAGADRVSQAQFAAYLQQTAEDFDAVASIPHHPPMARHYYLHPKIDGGDGKALGWLRGRFEPATDADDDLIMAAMLTLVWGGAPGHRPAFLVDSDDGRGAGKTTLVVLLASLVGGHIDARPGEEIDKLMTRLLSPAAIDRRVALLDNVKTLKFSWSDLEALITTDVISGRQLYVGEGRRPNTLTWFITLNNASLSKDLAQRCVIIKVKRPTRGPAWQAETQDFVAANRWAIIGDLLAVLKRRGHKLQQYSRWAAWEDAVLSRVAEPGEAQRVIEERQAAVDDDQAEADLVREAFCQELERHQHNPDTEAVWIPSVTVAKIVNEATGEKFATTRAGNYLKTLSIDELRRSDRKGQRGWAWRGQKTCPDTACVPFDDMFSRGAHG
jgi:hypothetical protein